LYTLLVETVHILEPLVNIVLEDSILNKLLLENVCTITKLIVDAVSLTVSLITLIAILYCASCASMRVIRYVKLQPCLQIVKIGSEFSH
jgi:hypothetical protein